MKIEVRRRRLFEELRVLAGVALVGSKELYYGFVAAAAVPGGAEAPLTLYGETALAIVRCGYLCCSPYLSWKGWPFDTKGGDIRRVGVALEPVPGGLRATVRSGEVGIRSDIFDAEVEGEGVQWLPVARVAAWLASCPGEVVSFSTERHGIVGTCGPARMMFLRPTSPIPQFPSPPLEALASLPSRAFESLARTGLYAGRAMYPESYRGQVEIAERELRIVSTDGYTLALAAASAKVAGPRQAFGLGWHAQHLLPSLARAAGAEEMQFSRTPQHLFFRFGPRLFCCRAAPPRLEDGEVILADPPIIARLSRPDLLAATSAVLLPGTGILHRGELVIDDGPEIRLAVESEMGSAEAVAPAETRFDRVALRAAAEGRARAQEESEVPPPLRLFVDLVRLHDAAARLDGDRLELGFYGPDEAFFVRPEGGSRTLAVMMPLLSESPHWRRLWD